MPIPKLISPRKYNNKEKPHKKYFLSRYGQYGKWKLFAYIIGGGAAAGFLLLAIAFLWFSRGLPDPNKLIDREVAQSTKILDRTGETVLYEISGEQKRTLISLNDIPQYARNATIAIEDKNFYNHKGFSIWAIFRTVVTNVLTGRKAGGSTLTQQFVKNAMLTNEKTYTRKIKELVMSYRLERTFEKDEILQMYLNEIPYGSNAYGIESASQKYFAKSAKDLTLAEAAILAALPQAPSFYSPYGTHKDRLIARQHYVLDVMVEQGYIAEEEAAEAKKQELVFKKSGEQITAPHFVMYIKEYLSEKYGEKTIEQGGLKIYTTLDLFKQKIAEEVIAAKTEDNEKRYNATNAALISIDPKTGQILAMVGSRDYFNDEIDGQVNITTSLRQPGSSIKPLVYTAAFIKGYTPDTLLYDVVTNFSTDPSKPYEPHNYDNGERGPITMKKALGGSLNIPAVKTIYLTGIDNVLKLANDLGYTSLKDRDRFGLSLVLGGGEVKLIEHANAFSAFAREGVLHQVTGILKVEDKNGQILEEFKEEDGQKVLDPKIARLTNDVLSDNNNRSWVFGEKNWLTLGNRPVAAKTGTTNDFRDAWAIGYTPSIVTGVWVGNNDNTAMKRGADGSQVAAPIWNAYMKQVLGDTPIEYFTKPEPIVTGKPVLDGQGGNETMVKIDKASGLLATDLTPPEMIIEKPFAVHHSILYYVKRDDPRGDPPADPNTDPQFRIWEDAVLKWAEKNGQATNTPPTGTDNIHTSSSTPEIIIRTPGENQEVSTSYLQTDIAINSQFPISFVEYYLDNLLAEKNQSAPFNFDSDISFLTNGYHNLKLKACDTYYNCASKSLDFNYTYKGDRVIITLLEPSSGLAANNIDFPLNISAAVEGYSKLSRIGAYYMDSFGQNYLISELNNPNAGTINLSWSSAPPTGTYRIYVKGDKKEGGTVKSKEAIININHLAQ